MQKQSANPESSFGRIMRCEEWHILSYLQLHLTVSAVQLGESESFIWSHIGGSKFQASKLTGQCSLDSLLKTEA
jgi:hypothetical protein